MIKDGFGGDGRRWGGSKADKGCGGLRMSRVSDDRGR